MIAKAVKGAGFRGAVEYDLGKDGGRMIDSNMAGETPRQLAAEFGELRKLRPNLGKAVLHVSLSAAVGEKLTDEQWRDIGKRYMDGMGLNNNQFVMTRHTDTEHEHVHILANRIQFNGQVTSDSNDYARQETIMRSIEREFGLKSVSSGRERRAMTKGEIEQGLRTDQPPIRLMLQQLCDEAAKDCHSIKEYQARLEVVGVELLPVVQQGGAKLSGLSYTLDGQTMKGSDLGKAYAPAGLSKRGVTYEQDRDYEGIRSSIERAERGTVSASLDASEVQERGGVRGGDRTPSGCDVGINRGRGAHDSGAGQEQQGSFNTTASGGENLANGGGTSGSGGGESGSGGGESARRVGGGGDEAAPISGGGGIVGGGCCGRIFNLAFPAHSGKSNRPSGDGGSIEASDNRGYEEQAGKVKPTAKRGRDDDDMSL